MPRSQAPSLPSSSTWGCVRSRFCRSPPFCSSSRRSRRIWSASTRPSIPPSPSPIKRTPPSCTTSKGRWTSTTSPSGMKRASPSSNTSISTSVRAKRSPSSAPRARARRRSSTFSRAFTTWGRGASPSTGTTSKTSRCIPCARRSASSCRSPSSSAAAF